MCAKLPNGFEKFFLRLVDLNVDIQCQKIENRELILSSFGEDRKIIKELFLSILNGKSKDIYSDNKQTNNYLKLFEQEIIRIQNYFYTNDKRYSDVDYNYKGKNLSRIILDIENQILQIMINYFTSKNVNILSLEYDGLKIYTDRNSKHFSINELEIENGPYIVKNILSFNNMIFDTCKHERIFFVDVFGIFLLGNFRNPLLFPYSLRDIHPNKRGLGLLAKEYIDRIHCRHFNGYFSPKLFILGY